MFIVMHCGGIPFNGDTIKSQSLGGSETAAYYMAKELAALGHKVTLFTGTDAPGVFDGVRYESAGDTTPDAPLGNRFMFYAQNTPADVLIIQRHPKAFQHRFAAKVNLWWLHDVALKRNQSDVNASLANIDGILTVSEYHKKQVIGAWGISPDTVFPITNGIDLALFEGLSNVERDPFGLVYSSRPERGLINLVGEGGIMEQLATIDPRFHLAVCAYDNRTPAMEQLYSYLEERCAALPNVMNVGALTKGQLAELMLGSGALVYPTQFEEVSCITAMEAMAAGCNIITSDYAALSETCKGSTSVLIPLKGGQIDKDAFIAAIIAKSKDVVSQSAQRRAAKKFAWPNAALAVDAIFKGMMGAHRFRPATVLNHLMRNSDIVAFEKARMTIDREACDPLTIKLEHEHSEAYRFFRGNTFADHYRAYYEYEKDRGVNYGPEDVSTTTRFCAVASRVQDLPDGATVLDYGCAHGHYTINLAKRFPALSFVGHDLAASNVEKAQKWAADEGLSNVVFIHGDHTTINGAYDLIIAAEVVEHAAKPAALVDALAANLTDDGTMVITTPYGPWEAQGYREHKYWRAHLHHFDRPDIHDLFGHHPDFKISAAPSGESQFATQLGSYIYSFGKPTLASGAVDYDRKLRELVPQQTLSVCIIAKDAEADIRRCITAVVSVADEVIVGVDESTKDKTLDVLSDLQREHPLVAWQVFHIPTVTETGFSRARNATIQRASCDWILWVDTDEVIINASTLHAYMRGNQFNGYAIKQHHFSVQPAGVIKTDLPVRLFRNGKGVQFFGLVHEHPEVKMNEGLGQVMLLNGVEIAHHGYSTEPVRRKRFARNIGLLAKDRKENPTRILGKFLWLRDLAQLNQYDVEYRRADPDKMFRRADEGIALWRELLKDNTRMAVDGLPYYSELVGIKGEGFEFSFAVDASKLGEAHCTKVSSVDGRYATTDDAFALMNALAKEKVADFDSRYF